MRIERSFCESLGHASYVVGCDRTGEAILVDPRRDVEGYFAYARDRSLRITRVVDTHGHNDYMSGVTEVVGRAPEVEVWASSAGQVGYGHRPVRDQERIDIGEVGVEIMHTPGHTPEHISLLLYDGDHDPDVPAVLLSGGALLVGDLARPDLLGGWDEAREAAKVFCRTIHEKLLALPDHVEVFPTHVSGSLCGGNIGSRLSTTVGYERRTNDVLVRLSASREPLEDCLSLEDLPAVPPYWRRMRAANMAGPPALGPLTEPAALRPDDVARVMAEGAVVLDCRSPEAFGGGHLPRALNVHLGPSFPTWAGTVLEAGARVVLVVDRPPDVWTAAGEPSEGRVVPDAQ